MEHELDEVAPEDKGVPDSIMAKAFDEIETDSLVNHYAASAESN